MTRDPGPAGPGRACVVFLGCPKNQVDTEGVLGSLAGAGFELTSEPSQADLVVVTTCAFLQSAVRESEAKIGEMLLLKRHRPEMRVVVAGCLVERFGAEMKERLPGIDALVGLRDMPRIAELLTRGVPGTGLRGRKPVMSRRVLSTPRHYAFLKIADGCDNRCSYCMIPDIRGGFQSRPMPEVVEEASGLAAAGVKELILVAQDTTQYGQDIYQRPSLGRLLGRLSRIDGVRWLRLMYTHPAHLSEDVIDQFGSNPKLCRYIDLPIQHVSDHLLAKMNRPYCRAALELVLASLRAIPDLHIRTTIIVGFPGETRADFEEMLDFVRAARFDRLSAYTYSPEPGTPAQRLGPQVPVRTRQARLRRLMNVQAAVSRTNLRRLVGRELAVLVDSAGRGRTEWDAPEVDGIVKLSGGPAQPGRLTRALVTGSSTHDLRARVMGRACP